MSNDYGRDDKQLFTVNGQRLYLSASEDDRFLGAASLADRQTRLFCETLSYTGCRISEALATTPRLLDREEQQIIFRTLKRRKRVFRAVPIPARLMRELAALAKELAPDERLWPWCRQTAWRRIKAIMASAQIDGPQAMPKGLRHKFGCSGIAHNIPETTVQELLGHAKLSSTRIYTATMGHERRALVRRMWPRSET